MGMIDFAVAATIVGLAAIAIAIGNRRMAEARRTAEIRRRLGLDKQTRKDW